MTADDWDGRRLIESITGAAASIDDPPSIVTAVGDDCMERRPTEAATVVGPTSPLSTLPAIEGIAAVAVDDDGYRLRCRSKVNAGSGGLTSTDRSPEFGPRLPPLAGLPVEQ